MSFSYQWLLEQISKFIEERSDLVYFDNYEDKYSVYTKSFEYLRNSAAFHTSSFVQEYISNLISDINIESRIIDIGCGSGATGMQFAFLGHDITFCDFEGIGLEFVRWLIEKEKYENAKVVPYENANRDFFVFYDIILAFDVLEHTGNHLAFIKWLASLGKRVILTFPINEPFYPPYENNKVLDEWVDWEAIQWIVYMRYFNIQFKIIDGRAYVDFTTSNEK